jgi:glucokinase
MGNENVTDITNAPSIRYNKTSRMYIPVKFANSNRLAATPLTVLAGDIGATKINLGLFQFTGKSFSIIRETRFLTKDFSEAEEMIGAFLPDEKADIISLGVAGPVQDEKVSITNMPWKIDARALSTRFKDSPVYLINDLEATAYGLSALKPADIHTIYEGKNTGKGNIGLIAPGTGLGEAGLYWDGTHYHPFATEGGHTDFAARTELDMELYRSCKLGALNQRSGYYHHFRFSSE